MYGKKPAERDKDLANRVLVLAWLAYDADRTSGRATYQLALALGALGRNEESVPLFEQAIAAQPEKADYYGDYAATLLWLDRPDDARRQIQRAKTRDWRNGQFDCIEGQIEEMEGNYRRALECYQWGRQKLARYPEAREEHRRSLRIVEQDIKRMEEKVPCIHIGIMI